MEHKKNILPEDEKIIKIFEDIAKSLRILSQREYRIRGKDE